MITLRNSIITASISPRGAELQSLQANGIEYLWQADSRWWGKHSPVLFPIVGSLVGDTYVHNEQAYSMGRHGFARDREFKAEQLSDTEALFTLQSDDESMQVYPFSFRLGLLYRVEGNALYCTYHVENTGSNVLLFSVGAHPAFNVPLVPGTQYTDHYLQFEACEPMNRWKLKDGLLTHVQETVPAFMGRVKLEPELFYEDALVFRHLQSASVTLASTTHKHSIKCSFPGFPFLGIWAAKDAPFVCIEPWCGHADFVGHNLLLDEKAGIINLAPGLDWRRTWQLELR